MNQFKKIVLAATLTGFFSACKKDNDPIIAVPTSSGATVQLNGIAAAEPGSAAGNSVYVDLSAEKQTPVLRSGWDLGFYCGNNFRVVLNHNTAAGARVLTSNDLAAVGAADTIGLTLSTSQTNPLNDLSCI